MMMKHPGVSVKLRRLSAQELELMLDRDEFRKWITSHRRLHVSLEKISPRCQKSGEASSPAPALARSGCATELSPSPSSVLASLATSTLTAAEENHGSTRRTKGRHEDTCGTQGVPSSSTRDRQPEVLIRSTGTDNSAEESHASARILTSTSRNPTSPPLCAAADHMDTGQAESDDDHSSAHNIHSEEEFLHHRSSSSAFAAIPRASLGSPLSTRDDSDSDSVVCCPQVTVQLHRLSAEEMNFVSNPPPCRDL